MVGKPRRHRVATVRLRLCGYSYHWGCCCRRYIVRAYIYIYGVLEIRDTSEKTRKMGLGRIKATLTALAVGLPMLLLRIYAHSHIESLGLVTFIDLLMILFGVLVTMAVGQKVGCGALTGLASVIYIILLISHANDERYLYAVLRASQTVIGVFVAWILNVWLFPYPGKDANRKE